MFVIDAFDEIDFCCRKPGSNFFYTRGRGCAFAFSANLLRIDYEVI